MNMNNRRWLYLAKFGYGHSHLTKVLIERETPKMYIPERDSEDHLFGWNYVGRRIRKVDTSAFLDIKEALSYLMIANSDYIEKMQRNINVAYY